MYLRIFALFLILLLGGCEAHTTIITRIRMPEYGSLKRDLLHIKLMRSNSFRFSLNLPGGRCPTFQEMKTTDKPDNIITMSNGFKVTQNAIPSVPEFCLAVWYDTNQNGKIDVGDGIGQLDTPYPSQPSKFFSSNRYFTPDIIVIRIPSTTNLK